MPNKLDEGFVKADSRNLPKVDSAMQFMFLCSPSFLAPESMNIKTFRSTRANYSDNAIGFVQLKRENGCCVVKAEITPEHRVRAGSYQLSCVIDEREDRIVSAKCNDCQAREGGCKHAVAFVSWLHRRSEEPSVTEVLCYWKRSRLATVGDSKSFVTADMMKAQKHAVVPEDKMQQVFDEGCAFLGKYAPGVSLMKQLQVKHSLSLFHLMIAFKKSVDVANHTSENFIAFCSLQMTEAECQSVAKKTASQSASASWFDVRYARISASKLLDTARCNTPDGSLVNSVFGVVKVKASDAMLRGLKLEPLILKSLGKRLSETVHRTGFVMSKDHPIFGASPDGILEEYIVEVKCPTSQKTWKNYFMNGETEPANKFKCQMLLQMLMCKKKSGLFCVADPDFEKNMKVKVLTVSWDENLCTEVMAQAKAFWSQNIYPQLYNSV